MTRLADMRERDPTNAAWAIAWARHYLRDTSEPFVFEDAELFAELEAHAMVDEGEAFYRPHATAAFMLRADPERAVSESLLGVNVTHRDVGEVATAITRSGAWIDDLIEAEVGSRPGAGRALRAVF